ncbi:GNAT family N-acetyltransferase [Nonomuraea angiospora]|uniref:GNAT family N-acetyltransferase n=1 Tax=Nonomuraea angiospora TaxID=46172 RepID=UPI00344CD86A
MSLFPPSRALTVLLRVMELRDVATAVRLHRAHLAEGFFVQLGDRLLRRYYLTYLTSPAAVALVAEVDRRMVEFLLGCTDVDIHRHHVARMERRRLARAGAAALLVRPELTGSFIRTRAQRYAQRLRAAGREASEHEPGERAGVLNHIAVDERMRRRGVGSRLVAAFADIAEVHGLRRLDLHAAQSEVPFHKHL